MRERKFGTWALTVALCGLSAACVDSTGTTEIDPDESDGEVGESGSEIRDSGNSGGLGPPAGGGGLNDPPRDNLWGGGYYGYGNGPFGNDPWNSNPYNNNPYNSGPFDNGPWGNGSNLGGYDYKVSSRFNSALPATSGIGSGLTGVAWVSAYQGGIGGEDYTVACETGEIATGVYGRAEEGIDQLGLVCSTVNLAGELGEESLRGFTGGEGGTYFISKCPAGQAIAGFAGRSNTTLNQLGLVCDSVPGTTLVYGDLFGGISGDEFFAISPHRFFVTRVTGRSGERIDSLQAIHHYVGP